MPRDNREDYLASGFRDVDGQKTLGKFVQCLNFLDNLPSFQHYKEAMISELAVKPGDTVIDVGCGLGFDVERLAGCVGPEGRAIGIDSSSAMLEMARKHTAEQDGLATYHLGDAHNLTLDDDLADACRIDRTLQHVEDPERVVKEMYRIVKPGGRLACAEPDWGTFTIADHRKPIVETLSEAWTRSFQNPWIGRQLPGLLRSSGIQKVALQGFLLVAEGFEAVDQVFDLCKTADKLSETQMNDHHDYDAWIHDLKRRDQASPLLATVTLFLASGTK